jgi:hypothetical protein
MYNHSSLQVTGYQKQPVANRFLQQKTNSQKLALVFPGLSYSCDMPLLYYLTEVLLDRDFDVLQLWTVYSSPDFKELSQIDQGQYLLADGSALLNAGQEAGAYKYILLAGKSIGTLAMASLLSQERSSLIDSTIWITPLLIIPAVTKVVFQLDSPAFYAGSDTDPTFDPSAVAQLRSLTNTTVEVIKDANHSLEIPGNPHKSLEALTKVMVSLTSFLN